MQQPSNVESSFSRCAGLGLKRNDPMDDVLLSPKVLSDLKKVNHSLMENAIPVMEKMYPFLISLHSLLLFLFHFHHHLIFFLCDLLTILLAFHLSI